MAGQEVLVTGAGVTLALGLVKVIEILAGKLRNGKNGNGKKQTLECALDHKSLGQVMARQTAILETLARDSAQLIVWHEPEIPGQPGTKKIWVDTKVAVDKVGRDVRQLVRNEGLTPAD